MAVKLLLGCAQVTVELKNDLAINGTLHSVDQYMNIKLDNVKVVNEDKFPHMVRPSPAPKLHCLQRHLENLNVPAWPSDVLWHSRRWCQLNTATGCDVCFMQLTACAQHNDNIEYASVSCSCLYAIALCAARS